MDAPTLRLSRRGLGAFYMVTAMIVDDSGLMRKMLRSTLEALDVTVACEAASGEEAVEQYAGCKPDFVTMDITMPGIDGVEATKRIVTKWPEAKIIVVTAMASDFLLDDAFAAGALGCVVKPFTQTQIRTEVRRVLGSSKGVRIRGDL